MSRRVNLAISVVLSMVLVLAIPLSAYADSFVEKPKEEYIFKVFPKKTTKYKPMGTKSTSVKKLYAEHKKIFALADTVSGYATYFGAIPVAPVQIVGAAVGAASTTVYKIAGYNKKKLSSYKAGVKLKTKTEWKWVKTSRMPYEMKVKWTQWYEYKGKVVGKKTVRTKTMHFAYGERW